MFKLLTSAALIASAAAFGGADTCIPNGDLCEGPDGIADGPSYCCDGSSCAEGYAFFNGDDQALCGGSPNDQGVWEWCSWSEGSTMCEADDQGNWSCDNGWSGDSGTMGQGWACPWVE